MLFIIRDEEHFFVSFLSFKPIVRNHILIKSFEALSNFCFMIIKS